MFDHPHAKLPHRWQNEIIAWANGETIECRYKDIHADNNWFRVTSPKWNHDELEFRIEPEHKPPVHLYAQIFWSENMEAYLCSALAYFRHDTDNLRITFDPNTNKIIAAEAL